MNYAPFVKRAIDVSICLILFPFALPVCVIAMVAISLEGGGSPLFVQNRVGRNQQIFRLFKLRTMRPDVGDLPSHEVDPIRITHVGAFLRRTKIDELPQLLNVLRGNMSLVGPRPCLPSQTLLIEERQRRQLYRFVSGVTGPGQVLGIDMSNPILLAEVEEQYFQNASCWSDIQLIFRTAIGNGRGDAAHNCN